MIFFGFQFLSIFSSPIHVINLSVIAPVKWNKQNNCFQKLERQGIYVTQQGWRPGTVPLCYEIPSSGVRTSSAGRKDGKLRLKARQRGDSLAELPPSVYSRIIGVMVKRWMFNIS